MKKPLVEVIVPNATKPSQRHCFNREKVINSFRDGHINWQREHQGQPVCVAGKFIYEALHFILRDSGQAFTETMLPRIPDRDCFEYRGVLVIRKEARNTETDPFTFV